MTDRAKNLLAVFVLACIIFLIYTPALHFDFIGLDDNNFVVRNPEIKIFNVERLWHLLSKPYLTLYIPVTMLSYLVDYQIWHLTAYGFRYTNVVLHFLNSVLVFTLIKCFHRNFSMALMAALIFAIHPAQIESVIWIAERKNLLSGFFLLLSLLAYWRAGSPGEEPHENRWLLSAALLY